MAQAHTAESLIYGVVVAGDPQLSPNGEQIVYTLAKNDPETKKSGSQLWLCDLDGGNARQLTHSGEKNGAPRWSPHGRQIAFVSDRVKKKSGLYIMALDGGEGRLLSQHLKGISGVAWSPDGSQIAYTTAFDPDNPDEDERDEDAAAPVRATRRIDYKQDGLGYLGDVRQQIFVVDVESGERRKVTHRPVDYNQPEWSPDGTRLAAQLPNRNGMCAQLVLIDVASGEELLVGPETGTVSSWSWSPNGDRIVFTGDTQQTWQSDFFVYETGNSTVKRVTEDLECLPNGAFGLGSGQPLWLDENNVLFVATRAGAGGIWKIDLSVGEAEQVAGGQATLAGLSSDSRGRYIVQGYSSLDSVGELAVYDLQSDKQQVITSYNKELLEERPPAQWERIEIERAGYPIEAWLLFPPNFDESKQYPLVISIHGGPNGFYGYTFENFMQQLASNGYLVVFANPRGSSSYGREFTLQVAKDWGGEDYLDLMAVVDKVLERPYADADRTGAWGYSYGGYMTSWILGQTDRFKAIVCGAPCFDLESMYGTSDISHTFGELQWGGGPQESEAWYKAHSPSSFAHRAKTPTLIVHGEADERCPIGQGEQMFIALKKAGCEVEFVRYPGGAHGFTRLGPPAHREDILRRHLEWFNRYLAD